MHVYKGKEVLGDFFSPEKLHFKINCSLLVYREETMSHIPNCKQNCIYS